MPSFVFFGTIAKFSGRRAGALMVTRQAAFGVTSKPGSKHDTVSKHLPLESVASMPPPNTSGGENVGIFASGKLTSWQTPATHAVSTPPTGGQVLSYDCPSIS